MDMDDLVEQAKGADVSTPCDQKGCNRDSEPMSFFCEKHSRSTQRDRIDGIL